MAVDKVVPVAKEVDEVVAAVAKIAAEILAKKPLVEVLVANLPALTLAAEGAQKIPDEIKLELEAVLNSVSLALVKIAAGILQKK